MRLIDADKIYPDCLTKTGRLAISQSQIAEAPTVEIPQGEDIPFTSLSCPSCFNSMWGYENGKIVCAVCGNTMADMRVNDDLISRKALKKALEVTQYNDIDDLTRTERLIDNALTVEVPENTVNCVLTMFGKCSYNETGCSDCEIKDKIRKALERPHVEYPKADSHKAYWDNVGRVDMREAENDY